MGSVCLPWLRGSGHRPPSPCLAGVGWTLGTVVSWGYCDTVPHAKWLTQQNLLSPGPGAWKSEMEGLVGPGPKASLLMCGRDVLSLCTSVCVCVPIPSSGKDPSHTGSGTPR